VKPRRLLLVNAEGGASTVGGAETIVAQLARGLVRRGWDVSILAAFPADDPVEVATLRTFYATSWRSSGRRRLLNHSRDVAAALTPSLARAVRAARPDLVHTHNLPGFSTAVWGAATRARARVVHTIHDYYLLCPRVTLVSPDGTSCARGAYCRLRSRRLRRWASEVADVVGVSTTVLDRHSGFFPSARHHVLRHPWPQEPRSATPAPATPRTIGFLGALDVTKGIDVVLDAAPRLAELGYELRIAGSGKLRGAVEAAAARLPAVHYAGRIAGVERETFLAQCDIGLVPSIWDEPGAPPLTLLEWLAAGRPVLSSGRGGLAELQGAQGVLDCEPTPEALVRAAAGLRDPRIWNDVRGAVRPPTVPSLDDWLDSYEDVFETALRQG
jgi:glycosyltransferase involved in cell wall biosynthesis